MLQCIPNIKFIYHYLLLIIFSMVSVDWWIEDLVRGALEAVLSEDRIIVIQGNCSAASKLYKKLCDSAKSKNIKHNENDDKYELMENQDYDYLFRFFEDRRFKNPKNLMVCMDYKNTFSDVTNRSHIIESLYIIKLDDIINSYGKD